MSVSTKLDELHYTVKGNRWFRYFTVFTRVALAAGFLGAGIVKITGERFTALPIKHPMGNYLEALSYTGYYYTFIGIAQTAAAFLLLIPRTATLGALLYFPIILNICILSLAVRFEGSLLTSPLMVLANLYLLCWDYDKLKYILPFNRTPTLVLPTMLSNKFPWKFAVGAFTGVVIMVVIITHMYNVMPRNSFNDCTRQCTGKNVEACNVFCDCIHNQGLSLDKSLAEYEKILKRAGGKK